MALAANPSTAWAILVVAGLPEIVWAISMKHSQGFTRLWPTLVTIGAAWCSFWLLGHAVKVLPIGTAYAAWTGFGAVGAALLGIMLFNEPATAARIACIVLIVAGIVGLKLLGADANA